MINAVGSDEEVSSYVGTPLLDVIDLTIRGRHGRDTFTIVDHVSFSLNRGDTFALVGESGSGKSMTARALLGLQPPGVALAGGSIRLEGKDLAIATSAELRRVRGRRIAMIFQDPMSSLNPVFSVGFQLREALAARHGDRSRTAAKLRAAELLADVGIPSPTTALGQYPHQFSGGMRQRIMIAMALAMEPDILVADEPTTALDVTVQQGILRLLQRLQAARGLALILISHDLGVVARVADEVAIMYAGKFVERGEVRDVYENPRHPYTRGLLAAVPAVDKAQEEFAGIPGLPPDLRDLPSGCPFHPRCDRSDGERCAVEPPELGSVPESGRLVACHYPVCHDLGGDRSRQ